MAQHDYVIANGTGAAVRSDLNNALAAIVSQNSGATAPSTTYAYMPWADSTTGLYKIRNAANNGWITLFQLDGEWSTLAVENGSAAAPSIYFKDSGTDTGIYSPGTDQVAISTGGTGRLFVDSSGRVGLGTSSPTDSSGYGTTLDIRGSTTGNGGVIYLRNSDASVTGQIAVYGDGRMDLGTTTNHPLKFYTNNAEKMRLDSSGRLGIGSTAPTNKLVVSDSGAGGFEVAPGASDVQTYFYNRSTSAYIQHTSLANSWRWSNGTTDRAVLDSSGRLLVGTSSTSQTCTLLVQGNSAASTSSGIIKLARGINNPSDGFSLGDLDFGDSGHVASASIGARRDGGTWTSGSSQPTRLVFSTTADGASSPTERMRITNVGDVYIKRTDASVGSVGAYFGADGLNIFTASGQRPLIVNRLASDGDLVVFYQDTVVEGSISVSGTTVSYNGAHLSRWSQLPGNAERTEILRGTVLSNIDEMCGWGEEENEQLNRMKVSDVEGDPNVSGVFQAWDDDDDTYTDDFYCAMTGDFIIRIAEGVTVQRGDLLMSAGDGTAKPQDDDIIRSKTVAKVTSTNVTCTYDDGSYCVPCVLMAC